MPLQTDSYRKYNSNEYTSINYVKNTEKNTRGYSKTLENEENQECPMWKEGELLETGVFQR